MAKKITLVLAIAVFTFFLIVPFISYRAYKSALKEEVFRHLVTTRDLLKFQIWNYFNQRYGDIDTLSRNPVIAQGLTRLVGAFHTLPVIDEKKKLLGVVNYDDIMKVFLLHNHVLEKLPRSTNICNIEKEVFLEAGFPKDLETTVTISDIMNTDVVTVKEDMSMIEARMLMRLHNIVKMPVTKNDVLVGFITLFDIIIALFKVMSIIK